MKDIVAPKVYLRTGAGLLVLLGLTWSISHIDLGPFNLIIALGIGMAKAFLIAVFFMDLRGSSPLVRLAALAGATWLLILLLLTLSDYLTR